MRTRPWLVVAVASVAVLMGCAEVDRPATESVATDPLTTVGPTAAPAASGPTTTVVTRDPNGSDGQVGSRIPDDFPLSAGWPRDTSEPGYKGLTGPNRTLPQIELAPCQVPADDPEYVDRLRAEWSDIVDHRARQLTTYDTDAAASAALRTIVDTYRSCPDTQPDPDPSVSYYELQETKYGDESWSVAATETYDGSPTTLLIVSHFVRVGHALLVDTDYGEGGFGPPGSLDRHVTRSAAEAEDVIAGMCVFSAVGC